MDKAIYQIYDSHLTLGEGLKEYYKINHEFIEGGDFLGMPGAIVKEHDALHVLFGFGTESKEELLLEMFTLLGCKTKPKRVSFITKINFFKEVLLMFGPYRLTKRLLLSIPEVLKLGLMILYAPKKWPHYGYEKYLNTPLWKLRMEFGIWNLTDLGTEKKKARSLAAD